MFTRMHFQRKAGSVAHNVHSQNMIHGIP